MGPKEIKHFKLTFRQTPDRSESESIECQEVAPTDYKVHSIQGLEKLQ